MICTSSSHPWWRAFCALSKKNALIKRRRLISTLCEIFLPVFAMILLVVIRVSISRTNNGPDLHIRAPPTQADFAVADQAIQDCSLRSCKPVMSNLTIDTNTGVQWRGLDAARLLHIRAPSDGTAAVQTIQFIGPEPHRTLLAQAFRDAYEVLASQVRTDFASEDELEDYVTSASYGADGSHPAIHHGIVLHSVAPHWSYSLRANFTGQLESSATLGTGLSLTERLQNDFDSLAFETLLLKGHHLMQDFVETWIIEQSLPPINATTPRRLDRQYYFQPFSTPSYVKDTFPDSVGRYLGFIFTIVFLWPLTRLIHSIVEEKQLRIKTGMMMMGLPESAWFASWWALYALVFFVVAVGMTLVLSLGVFTKSNPILIFVFLWLFGLSVFSFGYLVTVFFTRAQVASMVGGVCFFLCVLSTFSLNSASGMMRYILSIQPPVALSIGLVHIAQIEMVGGLQFNTVNFMIDRWAFRATIYMLVADIVAYLGFAWYLNQVIPTEFGTHKKWYFCFTRSYWKSVMSKIPRSHSAVPTQDSSSVHIHVSERESIAPSSEIESVSSSIAANLGVRIQNLHKTFNFNGSEQIAVNNLSMDLFSGQVLALLGRNGAGKTTTINMLCGMMAPTSGDAFVHNISIRDNMAEVRKILGVCPQHDILYDLLTVKEHLELYCAIKGVQSEDSAQHIASMIEQVGLTDKTDAASSALSGGAKRRLSVAIALLGGSKIVFLDEPTSGVDPASRRSIWNLLKKVREDRVIILTTHFMDEAEELGDRIAIMSKGELKCCGSSLFLKNKYGIGYTLAISKGARFQEQSVLALVSGCIRNATVLANVAGELSIRLALEDTALFPELFTTLDVRQESLGITAYSVSVTTLEEVFIRAVEDHRDTMHQSNSKESVAGGLQVNQPQIEGSGLNPSLPSRKDSIHFTPLLSSHSSTLKFPQPNSSKLDDEFARLRMPNADVSLLGVHIRALLIKRFLNAKRDRKVWLWTIALPILILLAGCGMSSLLGGSAPSFTLTPAGFFQDNSTPKSVPAPTILAPASVNATSINIFGAHPSYDGLSFENVKFMDGMDRTVVNTWLLDRIYPRSIDHEYRFFAFASELRPSADENFQFTDRFVVYFNSTGQFSSMLGLNVYNNQVLRALSNDSTASIAVTLHPLPQSKGLKSIAASMTAVIISIAFAFLPATFIGYVVREEQDKVKHQQMLSGVSAVAYWISNAIWDFLHLIFIGLISLLVFRIWSIADLLGEAAAACFLAILLYAFAIIPFCYLVSRYSREATSAQNAMLFFCIISGGLLLIVMLILTIIDSTKNFAKGVKFLLRIIPSYAFGECFANLLSRDSIAIYGHPREVFDLEVIGFPCIYLVCEGFIYFALVLAHEKWSASPAFRANVLACFSQLNCRTRAVCHITPSSDHLVPSVSMDDDIEDADVRAERSRLQAGNAVDAVQILGLRKEYESKAAVNDLWIGVPTGHCFGFLGVNGAGKSTTMKMLTSDLIPTAGTASLAGFDLLTEQPSIRRQIGYCAQFDTLIPALTAREHLTLFARIKGVQETIVHAYVEHLIARLGLQEGIADKPCRGYSGGNKRKLCVGMAMIGNPSILFLDEPSTGMDPVSKRFLWNLIAQVTRDRSVILTTHSMEECEALASTIGIMVDGRLRCLGSAPHLKNLYGNGFQVSCNLPEKFHDDFRVALDTYFGRDAHESDLCTQIVEHHGDLLKLWLPRNSSAAYLKAGDGDSRLCNNDGVGQISPQSPRFHQLSIGPLFQAMQTMLEPYSVREYSVSETTLEQIFIRLATTGTGAMKKSPSPEPC